MGTGYVVLQQNSGKKYTPLCNKLPWGNTDGFFHATFPDMSTWCRYCYEDGHTKYDCSFACDQFGHRQAECPRSPKSANTRTLKKLRKAPSREKTQEASSEIMKSKHASTPNTSIITPTTLSQTTISSSLSIYDSEDDDYVLDDIGMESNSDIMEEMCTPINILEESSALSTNAMNLDEDYNWQPDTINSSKIDFNHHHRSHLTENPHYDFLYRAPLLRERHLNIL